MEEFKDTNVLNYDRKLEILKDVLHEYKSLAKEGEKHLKDLEETQMELQYKLSTIHNLCEKAMEVDKHLASEFSKKAEQIGNELAVIELKISNINSSPLAIKMIKEEISKVKLE